MSGYLLLIIWVALSTLIHPSSHAQDTAPLIVSFWHVYPSGLPDQRRYHWQTFQSSLFWSQVYYQTEGIKGIRKAFGEIVSMFPELWRKETGSRGPRHQEIRAGRNLLWLGWEWSFQLQLSVHPQADGAWPSLAVKCECPSLESLMGKMVPMDRLSLGGY